MNNVRKIFITGGSRGIGLAIAKKMASTGAQVAIAAKTDTPHELLPGTIYSAAQEIEDCGGKAFPIKCDIRDENQIKSAVESAAQSMGGIDILINNASAINLTNTIDTPAKKFDLMIDVNVRGTFLASQAAIPYLKNGVNPAILTLSPPISLNGKWFKRNTAYTISKYGMSMCVIGMAEEFRRDKIAVNALWPRTAIDTAALRMIPGIDINFCRKPEIMADAAYEILTMNNFETGNFYIDDEVLQRAGVHDLDKYSVVPGTKEFIPDFYLD